MKTPSLALFLILTSLLTSVVRGADDTKPLSNTRTASAIVKVTVDPDIFQLNHESVPALLRSSTVAGKAGQQVLGSGTPDARDFIKLHFLRLPQSVTDETSEHRRITEELRHVESRIKELNQAKQDIEAIIKVLEDRLPEHSGADLQNARDQHVALKARQRELQSLYDEAQKNKAALLAERAIFSPETVFEISVTIPEDCEPAAEEFLAALIDNLRAALLNAAGSRRQELNDMLQLASVHQQEAQARLDEITKENQPITEALPRADSPEDAAVYAQLEQIVDLSRLNPEMTFGEAIEEVKDSVQPPLKIIVNWRDLMDTADIDRDTATNMDRISDIKLGKALDSLLETVGGGFIQLGYTIDGGTITIATAGSLPRKMVTRTYNLPASANAAELSQILLEVIDPDSWFENGGQGTVQVYQGRSLVIRQTPEVHRNIYHFLPKIITTPAPTQQVAAPGLSKQSLMNQKGSFLTNKRNSEMEIARLEARGSAIEQRIKEIRNQVNKTITDDPIARELQNIVDLKVKSQEAAQKAAVPNRVGSDEELREIAEEVVRARIELAKRREQLAKEAGGERLGQLTEELAQVSTLLAESQAALSITNRHLAQIDSQLAAAAARQTRESELRGAEEALQEAAARVTEIKTHLETLQTPTVKIIGAD